MNEPIANSQLPIPNSPLPLVACLTCTYGRFQRMRECLAFFLAQDYPAKRLFILNNHPTPLRCDLPDVTVFNEPSDEPGIPRQRLLELAIRNSQLPIDFVHTWDDDDAWLPWHLSQAVRQITVHRRGAEYAENGVFQGKDVAVLGDLPFGRELRVERRASAVQIAAWKPARSWIHFTRTGDYKLNSNNYEASMIVHFAEMLTIGYAKASGNEHRPLLDALKENDALGTTEVGARSSYIYSWRGDLTHASAPLGSSPRETWDATLPQRDAAWRKLQTDPGDGETPLTPADIGPRYLDLLAHCRSGLSEFEALELSALLDRYLTAEAQSSQRTGIQK